ncbi:MAG: GH36-type glycosyl hydrolase domain-containing protein [Planctomycetota bacterium]|jgi:cellobiose phosphorylase
MPEIGYFNTNATTYTITEMQPRRPLFNWMWNSEFLCYFDHFARGASWRRTEECFRNPLVEEGENRLIFLRDRESGNYWSANRNFDNEQFELWQTTVGVGYSTMSSVHHGIRCDFTFFIPREGPRECWKVVLTNTSDRNRPVTCFAYAASEIGKIFFQGANSSRVHADRNAVIQTNRVIDKPWPLPTAYFASDRTPDAFETSAKRFRGNYGYIAHPEAVKNGQLSNQDHVFDVELAGILQFDLELAPGESQTLNLVNGLSQTPETAREEIERSANASYFEEELTGVQAAFDTWRTRVSVATPDEEINALTNVWFKRQFQLGQTWGRAGGKGFRDTLQDNRACLTLDPDSALREIREILSHQYADGGGPKGWPASSEGAWQHRFRDQPAWIPETVVGYIKETGDRSILNEELPYFESNERGTVLDHMRCGMKYLFEGTGEHGLCLWGGGDWNDGINTAGIDGRGESVWLTQAAVLCAMTFADLLEEIGESDEAVSVLQQAALLTNALQVHGWDRDHFICGYNDRGDKIGAWENEEARIYLNMQTWAVLSKTVSDPVALMDVVEEHLKCDFGYVLHHPSYSKADDSIGRITCFESGTYENGSVYNHGVAFKIAADIAIGRPERALETIKMILPENRQNPAWPGHVEPYAITNMYLGPHNLRAGESIYSWATGTAGWLYRIIVEEMLGVKADYNGLRIRPCMPPEWTHVKLDRFFRGRMYHITIDNPLGLASGDVRIVADGSQLAGDLIPLPDRPGSSEVIVTVGE